MSHLFQHLHTRLLAMTQLSRSRARLMQLDDTLLADIGLSRDDAHREALRPVWDAPGHWLAGARAPFTPAHTDVCGGRAS